MDRLTTKVNSRLKTFSFQPQNYGHILFVWVGERGVATEKGETFEKWFNFKILALLFMAQMTDKTVSNSVVG